MICFKRCIPFLRIISGMPGYYILLLALTVFSSHALAKDFYVALNGDDRNPGTRIRPFATVQKAVHEARLFPNEKVNILLREGVYYLPATLTLSSEDSRAEGNELIMKAYRSEYVVIRGSKMIEADWKLVNGIYEAQINPDSPVFDQLYVNGRLMHMARYPNYHEKTLPFGGTAADTVIAKRTARWHAPAGGYLHGMQSSMWGGFSFLIKGKDSTGTLITEGGWQNNRPSEMHRQYRFVENVFEELDTLNEWYYDRNRHKLYLKSKENPGSALIEAPQMEILISITGSAGNPVKNIVIAGVTFQHTLRTFMKNKEPLLRSDWTVYRKGAVTLEYTEKIIINRCVLSDLGGNAVVYSNYNQRNVISGSHIFNAGGSAVVFAGDPAAVRSPSFQYKDYVRYEKIDRIPGPIGTNFPSDCTVYDNLIHNIGTVEKQTAGVQISMSQDITISHNTIYDVPRAGINVNEGTWGGHIIEFNDVFNTVLETGDHGAFNSWGRDRFWHPVRAEMDTLVAKHPELIFLDAVKPTVLFNNRFRCDNGWDIDLDDGSSNYIIKNNVCLSGGLKLREGFKRIAENNIMINNSFHPHVWFKNSMDVFKHNIVSTAYLPIRVTDWGTQVDSNFFTDENSLRKVRQSGIDLRSVSGDAQFRNEVRGNFKVKARSRASKAGFRNFDMKFGVVSKPLRRKARKVVIPAIFPQVWKEDAVYDFLGVKVKSLTTLAERSATGMPLATGVLVLDIPENNLLQPALKPNDVLLEMEGYKLITVKDLAAARLNFQSRKTARMKIFRDQREHIIIVNLK